jgi:transcription elongation factor SPT6
MVAMQIAAEPLVRQSLRQAFQSRAVICVKPTKKGRKVRTYMYAVLVL